MKASLSLVLVGVLACSRGPTLVDGGFVMKKGERVCLNDECDPRGIHLVDGGPLSSRSSILSFYEDSNSKTYAGIYADGGWWARSRDGGEAPFAIHGTERVCTNPACTAGWWSDGGSFGGEAFMSRGLIDSASALTLVGWTKQEALVRTDGGCEVPGDGGRFVHEESRLCAVLFDSVRKPDGGWGLY